MEIKIESILYNHNHKYIFIIPYSNTSKNAPDIIFSLSAIAISDSTTDYPLPIFIKTAFYLICLNLSKSKNLSVSGVRGIILTTKSALFKTLSQS